MKRIVMTMGLIITLAVGAFGQSAEVLTGLYERLTDIDQKAAIMAELLEMTDSSLELFFSSALDDLVYGDMSRYRTDKYTFDRWEELTRSVIRQLGSLGTDESAPSIWHVVESSETSLLKSDALVALGKIGAEEYAADVSMILRNLNFNTSSNYEDAEKEAFGAVFYLSRIKPDEGFEPLYYASDNWYSDRVKLFAKDILSSYLDDAGSRLTAIMLNTTDYVEKRQALGTMMDSDSPDSSKADVAMAALSEGHRYSDDDVGRSRERKILRLDAMADLIELGVNVEGVTSLLLRSVESGDMDERLLAIDTLGSRRCDDSNEILLDMLTGFNSKQANGIIINRDEQVALRQVLYALQAAGTEEAIIPLMEMRFLGYTPELIRVADQVICSIGTS